MKAANGEAVLRVFHLYTIPYTLYPDRRPRYSSPLAPQVVTSLWTFLWTHLIHDFKLLQSCTEYVCKSQSSRSFHAVFGSRLGRRRVGKCRKLVEFGAFV